MGFEPSGKFGTPNMTQEELYQQQKAFNKYLWENNINQNLPEEEKEKIKKSGFTNK